MEEALALCEISSKRRLTPLVLFCDTAGKEYLDKLVDAKTYRKPFGSEIERRVQTTPIRVIPRLHDYISVLIASMVNVWKVLRKASVGEKKAIYAIRIPQLLPYSSWFN